MKTWNALFTSLLEINMIMQSLLWWFPPYKNQKGRLTRNPGWGEEKKDLFLVLSFWKLTSSNFLSVFGWGSYLRGIAHSSKKVSSIHECLIVAACQKTFSFTQHCLQNIKSVPMPSREESTFSLVSQAWLWDYLKQPLSKTVYIRARCEQAIGVRGFKQPPYPFHIAFFKGTSLLVPVCAIPRRDVQLEVL